MEFWLDSDARRSSRLLLSAVYCVEAVDAMALMDAMPSSLELASFFCYLSLLRRTLHLLLWATDGGCGKCC
ncbi:unnamed protein product [Penicillium nalgiovense]|nr:unnamed protein product [Penicillium nalgiovense]CAG8252359.1 unnamed protein product [Penicillium nalgiovense]